MPETSGFFNSQVDEEGTYDRVYLAGDFANYFSSLISNGIFGGKLNELQVIADSGMNVLVQTGRAFIEGYWYQNSEPLQIAIPANTTGQLQFYAIAIRLDKTQRSINAVLKGPVGQDSGGEVANPTRNDSIYELTLALITLPTGSTSIKQNLIIDKRAQTDLCGFVTGLIKQIDTTEFATQLDTYIAETAERTQALQDALDSDIQNITNDTPAMLKSVYDKDNDGIVDYASQIGIEYEALLHTTGTGVSLGSGKICIRDTKVLLNCTFNLSSSFFNLLVKNAPSGSIPIASFQLNYNQINLKTPLLIPCIITSSGTYGDNAHSIAFLYGSFVTTKIDNNDVVMLNLSLFPQSGNAGLQGGTPSWDYTYIKVANPSPHGTLFINFERSLWEAV